MLHIARVTACTWGIHLHVSQMGNIRGRYLNISGRLILHLRVYEEKIYVLGIVSINVLVLSVRMEKNIYLTIILQLFIAWTCITYYV